MVESPDQRRPDAKGALRSALTESDGWGSCCTNQIPSDVNKVPFVWDDSGTQCKMAFAAGVTGVDFDDDTFLALGSGTPDYRRAWSLDPSP